MMIVLHCQKTQGHHRAMWYNKNRKGSNVATIVNQNTESEGLVSKLQRKFYLKNEGISWYST